MSKEHNSSNTEEENIFLTNDCVTAQDVLIWFLCECNQSGINCAINGENRCVIKINGATFAIEIHDNMQNR